MKRISVLCGLLLLFSFLLTTAGCAGAANDLSESDVEFWSAPITEKIMQDQYDIYSEVKGGASIDMRMAKNEYESAQIIITPGKKLSHYDLRMSDLVASSGQKISSDNITVYHQKYIEVTRIYNRTDVPTGWYPDALVPFSAIKERGENVVEAGQNQGVVLDIYVPSETVSGLYSGTLEIDCGSFEKNIPIRVDVADFTVSEVTHSKSVFLNNWHYGWGELNDTREMYEIYNNALSKYRLSPWTFFVNDWEKNFTADRIPEYVDMVYEYAKQPGNSTYSLAYRTTDTSFDKELFRDTILALANKSFESGIDLLSKAVAYLSMIDEPDQFDYAAAKVPEVCDNFKWALEAAASEIEKDTSVLSPIKDQVVASIRKIPNIVTSGYSSRFEDYIDTWCPKVDAYNTEAGRANYADQQEKWWYTCISPIAPFPSYHIEDKLYSARILSWMAMDYGVVGNLYWATDVYGQMLDGSYTYIEDYYQTADRYPGVNGDGFLFYPGKRYGVEGPLPSVRMLAIRDGNEDYEMLYDLKEQYEQISRASGYEFGYDSVMDNIYGSLYSGTEVMTDSGRFAAARKSLFELEEAVNSQARLCVAKQSEKNGTVEFEIIVKDGFDLSADGKILSSYQKYGSGENAIRVYSYEKRLESSGKNTATFSVQTDNGEVCVNFNLGGAVQYVSAEQLNGTVEVNFGNVTQNGEWIEAAFDKADDNAAQELIISNPVLDEIGVNTQKLVFTLNNLSEQDVEYIVLFDYEKMNYYFDETSGILSANGSKTVSIENIHAFTWSRYGKLERIIIRFGSKGDAARTVQFGGFYVYGV